MKDAYAASVVSDPSRHGWRHLPRRVHTRMRRTKVIDCAHQEHALVQRQGVVSQRREAFPKRRVEPVTVDGGIALSTSASQPCVPLLRHTAPP